MYVIYDDVNIYICTRRAHLCFSSMFWILYLIYVITEHFAKLRIIESISKTFCLSEKRKEVSK